jgi:hypothetical protein
MVPLTVVAAMSLPTMCTPSSLPVAGFCEHGNIEQFSEDAKKAVERIDEEKNGLDASDIELLRLRQQAKERAESLKTILGYDLDGDFSVDRAEMRRAVPGDFRTNDGRKSSNADERMRTLFFTYDADRDERIERDEILNAPLQMGNLQFLEGLRSMLALDPNRDGRLDYDELRRLAEEAFTSADEDGDGSISSKEAAALWESSKQRGQGRFEGVDGRVCAMPKVPAEAALVVFSSDRGNLSPDGNMTADVNVEAGSPPLYVILTSTAPIQWRLSGGVERVVQLVLSARTTAGVPEAKGLPAE